MSEHTVSALPFTPIAEESARQYIVYVFVHRDSGRMYVGMTISSLARRAREHFKGCTARTRTGPFAVAIRQYGRDAFDAYIVADAMTKTEAEVCEDDLIIRLGTTDPNKGFNAHTASLPWTLSDTQKKRHSENLRGLYAARRSRGIRSPHSILVRQISLAGELVAVHQTLTDASAASGVAAASISKCVNGHAASAGGFHWATDGKARREKTASVEQLLTDGTTVVCTYPSIAGAASATSLASWKIYAAIDGRRADAGGFRWRYANGHTRSTRPIKYKRVEQIADDGTVVAIHNSTMEAADAVNCDPAYISQAATGRMLKARGFRWRYVPKSA